MATSNGDDLCKQPAFTSQDAEFILERHFGIAGRASPLPSERDQNFQVDSTAGRYVLKIANPDTDIVVLELENQAIRLAEAIDCFNSAPLFKSLDGQTVIRLNDKAGATFYVRCLGYVPGVPLAKIANPAPELLEQIGIALASLDRALSALNQNWIAKRKLKWDLKQAPGIVQEAIPKISDPEKRDLLESVLAHYNKVKSRVVRLPKSVIHNDFNDYNIMVDEEFEPPRLGLIDFGDIVYSSTINNLAICLAYVILDKPDPLTIASRVVAGYNEIRRLSEQELSVLFPLINLRLAQSVCIASAQMLVRPDNDYLSITERPAWSMLERLSNIVPQQARMKFSDGF